MEMSQAVLVVLPRCLRQMPLHTFLKQVSGAGGGGVGSVAKEPKQSYLVDPAFGSMTVILLALFHNFGPLNTFCETEL